MRLELISDSLWQGVPFVIQVHPDSGEALPKQILVEPAVDSQIEPFFVPIREVSGHQGLAELSIQFPGEFKATVGTAGTPFSFRIQSRNSMSFGQEFGILGGVSLLFAGGILIWIIKMLKRSAKKKTIA